MHWALATVLFGICACAHSEPRFCHESPRIEPEGGSRGGTSKGALLSGAAFSSSADARILPKRHQVRCLQWGTDRLVSALTRAAAFVRSQRPDSPPLGVGNIGRAQGGPISFYSRSHQAGRDVDLAFYELGVDGTPVPTEDLRRFGPSLQAEDSSGHRFDVERNWLLVRALLTDASIDVQWLFVSTPLKEALLGEAIRREEPPELLARARAILHQPTDADAHDDHLHLRLYCTARERELGCRD